MMNDEYAYYHLAQHLLKANKKTQLIEAVKSKRWFNKKVTFDNSRRIYANDVSLVLTVTQGQYAHGLHNYIIYSFIFGALGSLTTNIDPEALALMIMVGQAEQAERFATLYTNPVTQTEAYQLMMKAFIARGDKKAAQRTQAQMVRRVQTLPRDNTRDRAALSAAEACGWLSFFQLSRQLLEEIVDTEFRERGLAQLAVQLAEAQDISAALEIVSQLSYHHHSVTALAKIIHLYPDASIKLSLQQRLYNRLSQISFANLPPEYAAGVVSALFLIGQDQIAWDIAERALDVLWLGRAWRWLVRADQPHRAYHLLEQLPPDKQTLLEATDRIFIYAGIGDFDRALSLIDEVPTRKTRDGTFAALAAPFIQAGKPEAAFQLVERIQQPAVQTWALATMGQIFALSGDMSGAQRTLRQLLANTLNTSSLKWQTLASDLAGILANAGQAQEGLILVESQENKQDDMLIATARQQIERHQLSQAQQTIEQIIDDDQRGVLLSELIYQLCRIGEIDDAGKLIQAVPRVAFKQAVIYVARSLAQIGQLEQSVAFIKFIPPSGARDEAYRELILGELQNGHFHTLNKFIHSIRSDAIKTHLQSDYALELAKQGQLTKALEIASSIKRERLRYDAIAVIASLAYPDNKSLSDECLKMCAGTRYYRKIAVAVASKIVQHGSLEEAVSLINPLPSQEQKKAWTGIVRSLIHMGQFASLTEVFLSFVRTQNPDIARSIISGLMAVNQMEDVEQFIDEVSDPRQKFTVIARLATYYTERGNLPRALDFIEKSDPQRAHWGTLIKMSLIVAQQGRFEQALQLTVRLQSATDRRKAWEGIAQMLAHTDQETQLRTVHQAFEIARSHSQGDVINCLIAFSPVLTTWMTPAHLINLLQQLEQIQLSLFSFTD